MSGDCCVDLPCGAMGLSALCDCGIPDHTHLLFLSPPVNFFTDRSKAVLLLWIIHVIYIVFLFCFCARMWSPAGKGLTSWLLFVVSNCEAVCLFVCLFLLLYVPCQQLWSLRDGQFT